MIMNLVLSVNLYRTSKFELMTREKYWLVVRISCVVIGEILMKLLVR